VAPFHIGAGALKHLRKRFGLVFELGLLHRAQRAQGTTGLTQWSPEARGKRTQRLALGYCPGRGHPSEVIRGNEMGMHGVGLSRR